MKHPICPPQPNQRPKFCAVYFFDTENELENRIAHGADYWKTDPGEEDAQKEVILMIQQMIHKMSPFIKQLVTHSEQEDLDIYTIAIKSDIPENDHPGRYNAPTASQVAAFITEPGDGANSYREFVLTFNKTDPNAETEFTSVPVWHDKYDALQYPLLIPDGRGTWSHGQLVNFNREED